MRRKGFTLIELLVVIAIIAILAALLFPVLATMRAANAKNGCMGNLAEMIRAAKMYKDDWRVYPEQLYGVCPAGQCREEVLPIGSPPDAPPSLRLYPDYIKDKRTFTCPSQVPRVDTKHASWVGVTHPVTGVALPYGLAPWSTYDANANELHYALRWSDAAHPEYMRQLQFKNPPDSTVVTWCRLHENMVLVAFISGRVQTIPANQVRDFSNPATAPWTVSPKP